jgi:hypothetical protein
MVTLENDTTYAFIGRPLYCIPSLVKIDRRQVVDDDILKHLQYDKNVPRPEH